jgi:hypothetical protein
MVDGLMRLLKSNTNRKPLEMREFNQLVWEDDFDGPTLDYTQWECEVNSFGVGNQELQMYTDSPCNVRVEDSKLILEAHR